MHRRTVSNSVLPSSHSGTGPNALVISASTPARMQSIDFSSSSPRPRGHMDKPLTHLAHMPTGVYYQRL